MSRMVLAGEKGVDFSFARPPAARLLELGYTFVVGYISVPPASPAKNITRAECEAYLAAGLKVLLVWEMSASRANLGAAYGAIDGANARIQAEARGCPVDVPILIADDTNTTGIVKKVWAALKRVFSGGNIDAHEDYMFAALGAIAPYSIGEYGDCDILERTQGLWKIGWVPNAWSWSAGSRKKADDRARSLGAHVLQRTGFYIDDTWAVDPNEVIADFPAWGNPLPLPHPDTGPIPEPHLEDDMAIRLLAPTDSPGRFFAMCTAGGVAIRCEWTGLGDDPRVAARIAAHQAAGMTDLPCTVADLINVSLDGICPDGFMPEQFANPGEIRARMAVPDVSQITADVADLKVSTSLVRAALVGVAEELGKVAG